jgi:hypothetical protein
LNIDFLNTLLSSFRPPSSVAREADEDKNGSKPTMHLNAGALETIKSLQRSDQKRTEVVFPNDTKDFVTNSWFHRCLKDAEITHYVWRCSASGAKSKRTLDGIGTVPGNPSSSGLLALKGRVVNKGIL